MDPHDACIDVLLTPVDLESRRIEESSVQCRIEAGFVERMSNLVHCRSHIGVASLKRRAGWRLDTGKGAQDKP